MPASEEAAESETHRLILAEENGIKAGQRIIDENVHPCSC
jgi:hypothetical protein